MNVLIDKSFEKDVEIITDKKTLTSILECIKDIQSKNKLSELSNCKKLKGSKNAYRIRIGQYRIGFIFENQNVDLIRFLHRSKIYLYFPE